MKPVWPFVLMLSALAAAPRAQAQTQPLQGGQPIAHGLFSDVRLSRPAGAPQQFVMLLSDGDGAAPAEQRMVRSMVTAGAMVAVVPMASFQPRLERQDGKCTYGAGAFENLSRHLQAAERLPGYLLPMLVGSGGTAGYAYALLAQAPAGTFASALSLGFCPRYAYKTPPCPSNALRSQSTADGAIELQPTAALTAPWAAGAPEASCAAAAQAFVQRIPQASWIASADGFDAAYARLATPQVPLDLPPPHLADLPIVEAPVGPRAAGKRFAVLLSGDGGWAAIDKGIAAGLVAQGVPVAGFDSLRYFWTARTPEGLAADLDRIIRYYAARWNRSEVVLIGYSQGADVLPFALNRLPAGSRSRVQLTALLGPGQKASFEFHLTNWIGPSGDKPIAPEARKLSAARTVCIYGQDERHSLCPELAPAHARPLPLSGGHHFGGDYEALAGRILDAVPK